MQQGSGPREALQICPGSGKTEAHRSLAAYEHLPS
jgi:hypothetical protein